MAIDSILHVFVGGIITLILFKNKVRGIIILATLVTLSAGKEFYDHFFVLGHCYPACMPEHISDFLFSLVFFFLYLPIFSITHNSFSEKITYKHFLLIWASLAITQLAMTNFTGHSNQVNLVKLNTVCMK